MTRSPHVLTCPYCGKDHEVTLVVSRGDPLLFRPGTPMFRVARRFPVSATCPNTQKVFEAQVEVLDLPETSPVESVTVESRSL